MLNKNTILKTIELAIEYNVAIGAHPSFVDKKNFGRQFLDLSEAVLKQSIEEQLDLFLSFNGSNYFLKQEAMAWEAAYTLIQSFGTGASMYQINTKEEEDAVYNKLFDLGFAGPGNSPNNHFWLGLNSITHQN